MLDGLEGSNRSTELDAVQQAGPAAFKLTDKEATSDALPFGNGYCILHLEKVTPSRQLTLEEARPEIIEQIKTERANTALASNGNETRAKIDAALKAGKSFADAAKDAGKKVEEFPVFSIAEPPEDRPDARDIISKAVELNDGELSEFLVGPQGGLLIHLDSRDPIDEAKFKKDAETQMQQARKSQSFIAFNEWLRSRRKSANMQQTGPR